MKQMLVGSHVSEMQKKSGDNNDSACVEFGSSSSLGHISAEFKPCWDSCASLPFLTLLCVYFIICGHYNTHCLKMNKLMYMDSTLWNQ